MRIHLAFLPLALAAGTLVAADDTHDFRWMQFQGGITDHRTDNVGHQQPAIGFGVGTWVNKHLGLEASGLGTFVNYGYGKAKEAHAMGSLLVSPFGTRAMIRPFLRLGLGATTIGSPVSGKGSHTTRFSGTLGLGAQFLLGKQMFASLEGRLVRIDTHRSRKEGQALAGIGVRWGNAAPAPVTVYVPAPTPPAPAPVPAQVIVMPAATPAPVTVTEKQVIYVPVPAPVIERKIILEEATLHFANGKAILSREGREAVNKVARELKEIRAPYQILVSGHTSKVGKASFNLQLSKARAEAVANVLKEAGIPAQSIRSEGLSFSQPRVQEKTKADQGINRRVEIDIKTAASNVELSDKETPVVE